MRSRLLKKVDVNADLLETIFICGNNINAYLADRFTCVVGSPYE